jgi:hypothetical protein
MPLPPGNPVYAEAVLVRNIEFQSNAASYLSNGALTALAVLLAAYSLLFTIVTQRGILPSGWEINASVAGVVASGIMFSLAWQRAGVRAGPDPLQVTRDLVVTGLPEPQVRAGVIDLLVLTYGKNRDRLAVGRLLLALAMPVAAIGILLFIYGAGALTH